MSTSIEPEVGFGFSGNISCTIDDRMAFICGCSVQLYNFRTGARNYIYSPRQKPLQCLAVNARKNMIAVGEKARNPKIFIFSIPEMVKVAELQNSTKIEFADIAFDRTGQLLVTLGGIPECELKVWQIGVGAAEKTSAMPFELPKIVEPQVLCEIAMGTAHARQITFNPSNSLELCATGGGAVTFWRIERQHTKFSLAKSDAKPPPPPEGTDRQPKFHQHVWAAVQGAKQSEVISGTLDGGLYRFDPVSGAGEVIMESGKAETNERITALVVTKHHVIAASTSGNQPTLLFVNNQTRNLDCAVKLPTNSIKDTQVYVNSIAVSRTWDSFVMACSDGMVLFAELQNYASGILDANTIQVSLIADFSPAGEVVATSAMALGGGGKVVASAMILDRKLVTVGSDCLLRVWDMASPPMQPNVPQAYTLMCKIHIGIDPYCLAQNQQGKMIALGFKTGMIRVYEYAADGTMYDTDDASGAALSGLMYSELLDKSDVIALAFSPSGLYLAVALANGRLYILETSPIRVVGFMHCIPLNPVAAQPVAVVPPAAVLNPKDKKEPAKEAPAPPQQQKEEKPVHITDIAWIKPVDELGDEAEDASARETILVALENGDLMEFKAPGENQQSVVWAPEMCLNMWKMDYAAAKVMYAKQFGAVHHIFTCAEDKAVKFYILPKVSDVKDETLIPLSIAHTSFNDFAKRATHLCMSSDENWMLCTGGDGKVTVRNIAHFLKPDPPKQSSSGKLFTAQCHWPFSGGCTSGCFTSDSKNIVTVGGDGFMFYYSLRAPIRQEGRGLMYLVNDLPEITPAREETENHTQKAIKAHEEHEARTYAATRQKALQRVQALRQQLTELKALNAVSGNEEQLPPEEFVVPSLRSEMWEKGTGAVAELRDDLMWKNIGRDYMADKVKRECWEVMEDKLTRLQGMASEAHTYNYNARVKSEKEIGITRKVKFLRKLELMDQRARSGGPLDSITISNNNDELMYSCFDEYTRFRMITQVHILQDEIRNLKKDFNSAQNDLMSRKKNEIMRIAEKNQRIYEIMQQLDTNEQIFEPALTLEEQPKLLLEVKDEEVTVEKWLTDDEKQRQQEMSVEAERRRKEQEDESVDRGLKIMMDGKLQREDTMKERLHKPDFIEKKPQDEWTDEEVKMHKEYEQRLKKQQDEEEKKRKQLEAELKNIRKENMEIAQAWDTSLNELFFRKLDTDQIIYEIELRIIKLAQSVFQQEEWAQKEEKLAQVLDEIKQRTAKSTQHVMDFKREFDSKQELLRKLQEEEKLSDKKFKSQFTDADEYTDVLLKLLKKKGKQKNKSKAQDLADKEKEEAQRSSDPFAQADLKIRQVVEVAEVKLDKPEGLQDHLWRDFLSYRDYRNDADRKLKEVLQEVEDLKVHYNKVKGDNEELHMKMEVNLRKLQEFREQLGKDAYNLDLLHKLKQGQIEVEHAAVVTDYADAVLIDRSQIQALNNDIRSVGTEKVDILKDIKDFKKGIRQIEWEIELLDYTMGTLELQYKHLHTLRVTKAMQEFVKGGGENHNENERQKIVQKIQHVKNTFDQKIIERKQQINKLKRHIETREVENESLFDKTGSAQTLVDERDDIVCLQSTGLDQARAHKMMKDLRVTRKLEDVAKAQQEELKELKNEINRLRERTFPSFAVVSKRVVGNQDELRPIQSA